MQETALRRKSVVTIAKYRGGAAGTAAPQQSASRADARRVFRQVIAWAANGIIGIRHCAAGRRCVLFGRGRGTTTTMIAEQPPALAAVLGRAPVAVVAVARVVARLATLPAFDAAAFAAAATRTAESVARATDQRGQDENGQHRKHCTFHNRFLVFALGNAGPTGSDAGKSRPPFITHRPEESLESRKLIEPLPPPTSAIPVFQGKSAATV
jgi:hypothetical protein